MAVWKSFAWTKTNQHSAVVSLFHFRFPSESQHLVLVIQNPLPVEFKCRMQIAYKGAEIQLREITLTFEPKQVLEVDVDVLPVCSGTVEFTGYQLVLMGGYKCFVETAKIAPSALKGWNFYSFALSNITKNSQLGLNFHQILTKVLKVSP